MEKGKMEKEDNNRSPHIGVLSYNISLSICIQNLKTLALIGAEKSLTYCRERKRD